MKSDDINTRNTEKDIIVDLNVHIHNFSSLIACTFLSINYN